MVTKRRGFTLIELLVVIAIIAILAAILMPVFSRAREKGRQASCTSNLKQWGLAMLQYVQDFDERLPAVTCGDSFLAGCTGAYNGLIPWPISMQPYLKSYQVGICPSDSNRACFSKCGLAGGYEPILLQVNWPGASAGMMPAQCAEVFPLSYAANYFLSENTINSSTLRGGISIAQINAPAKIIFMSEYGKGTAPWSATVYGTYYMIPGYNSGTPTSRFRASGRHSEGRVWNFCDGHAKWYKDEWGNSDAETQASYRRRGVEWDPRT